MPLLTTLGVILYFRSKAWFTVALIAALAFVALDYQTLYNKVVVGNVQEGSNNRVLLWQINLELIANHPLFGVGPAGYAPYYMTYHPDFAMSTHNNYFDILAQTGIAGSLVFIWFIATTLVVGNRSRKNTSGKRNFQEGFAVATFAGTLGMLVAMMLGDWVLPFAYNQTISGFDNAVFNWIFIGGMVSLYLLNKNQPEKAGAEAGEL
jgi:O-antigen ligase